MLEKLPYVKDYERQSTLIVVNDIVYTSISSQNGAKKALKKSYETLMKLCNSKAKKDEN